MYRKNMHLLIKKNAFMNNVLGAHTKQRILINIYVTHGSDLSLGVCHSSLGGGFILV